MVLLWLPLAPLREPGRPRSIAHVAAHRMTTTTTIPLREAGGAVLVGGHQAIPSRSAPEELVMVFYFDIPHLQTQAKKAAKASGQRLSQAQHAIAKAKGYTSWSAMVGAVVGPDDPECLVAWFERKHEPMETAAHGLPVPPRAILAAAGHGAAAGFEGAVRALEGRGPWRRKGPQGTIRKSSNADLAEVLRWSKQDEDNEEISFYCNRNVISECHDEGELYVLVDPATDLPIAFLANGRYEPYILSVKADRRGEQHGYALAQFMIDLWRTTDASAIEFECAPKSSIPFWQHMGFQMYRPDRAYMLLPKVYELPPGAPGAEVKITFYPEQVQYREDVASLMMATPRAVRTGSGTISLAERVFVFENLIPGNHKDIVVSIEVDDREVYRDKAKYPGASALGVRRDGQGWFIDEIRLPGN